MATNTVARIATITFEKIPMPNQTITMGATANMGMELMAMTYGVTTLDTLGQYHNPSPILAPRVVPTIKPIKVSKIVTPAWMNISPEIVMVASAVTIFVGLEKKNVVSGNAIETDCQAARKATSGRRC